MFGLGSDLADDLRRKGGLPGEEDGPGAVLGRAGRALLKELLGVRTLGGSGGGGGVDSRAREPATIASGKGDCIRE